MMINRDKFKKSESFKNVEKDLAYIVSKIREDEELLKLLSLKENSQNKLTEKEKKEILEECVRIVPKITELNEEGWSYLTIQFRQFSANGDNPKYRDKFLVFNIVCNFDTWNMGDFKLRPYQIAGRLDVLFDRKSLIDTYTINFISAEPLILNEEIAGISLAYLVTYGIDRDGNDD